jgi:hypothetical protein
VAKKDEELDLLDEQLEALEQRGQGLTVLPTASLSH